VVTELKDTADSFFHDTFQNWRAKHPRGVFLAFATKGKANLHGAGCQHLGSTDWLVEEGGYSLTKNLKVLDDGRGSIQRWVDEHPATNIHRCAHCLRDKLIDESSLNSPAPIDRADKGQARRARSQRGKSQRAVSAPAGAGPDILSSHPFADELTQESVILGREDLSPTEKESLIRARRGQGRYRQDLERVEIGCRVTGIIDRRHLRASHIKPWHVSNDQEKLDPNNGLLLAPHVDHLFDRGYVSFTDEGELLVSKALNPVVLSTWGLTVPMRKEAFSEKQRVYLAYHRKSVFERHGRSKESDGGEPSDTDSPSAEIVLREIVPGSG
jgi:hypothetical protein